MEYVIGQVWFSLVIAAALAGLAGWLLHSILTRGRIRAAEAQKNLEVEDLRSELESERVKQRGLTGMIESANAQTKEAEAKLQSTIKDATEGARRLGLDVTQLKTRVAQLEPLKTQVEDRDKRIEGWQQRFDGLVKEKDEAIAALMSEIEGVHSAPDESAAYRNKLAAMGTSLAAAIAARESLEAQLADHRQTLETLQKHLGSAVAEKDAEIRAAKERALELTGQVEHLESELPVLRMKLIEAEDRDAAHAGQFETLRKAHLEAVTEAEARIAQKDEELKTFDQRMRASIAEKDTVIGRLRSLAARVDPLRTELNQRDRAIEQMQQQLQGAPAPQLEAELAKSRSESDALRGARQDMESTLAEAQRQIHAMLAANRGMRTALDGKDAEIAALRSKAGASASGPAPAPAAELERLLRYAVDMAGRHAAARGQLETRASQIEALEAHLRAEAASREASQAELESARDHIARIQGEMAQIDARMVGALRDREGKDERIAWLERQTADMAGHHAAAKAELDEQSRRIAILESNLGAQASASEGLSLELEAKQRELERTRRDLAALDAQVVRAGPNDAPPLASESEKLLAVDAERDEQLRLMIASQEQELAELRAHLNDRDERLESLMNMLDAPAGSSTSMPLAFSAAAGGEPALALAPPQQVVFGHSGSPPVVKLVTPKSPFSRSEAAARLRTLIESDVRASGIQFLPRSAELIPDSLPILAEAAEAMLKYPDVTVEIAGHTDSWGEPQDNFRLSQQRAGAVKEYLINEGIAAWRVVDIGYGDTRPIETNDTADGRFANRRIEFHVRY